MFREVLERELEAKGDGQEQMLESLGESNEAQSSLLFLNSNLQFLPNSIMDYHSTKRNRLELEGRYS